MSQTKWNKVIESEKLVFIINYAIIIWELLESNNVNFETDVINIAI